MAKRRHSNYGLWEPLRELRRKLRMQHNHPHYVGNGNESLRLDQLIASNPPEGGLRSYVADLEKRANVSSAPSALDTPPGAAASGSPRRSVRTN